MPFLRIETNRSSATAAETAALQARLTARISEIKGDDEKMISTVIVEGAAVSFGGDAAAPAAIVTLTNAAMPKEVTLPLTRALTEAIGGAYGVPPDRMYIFFHEYTAGHLVGWNGETFDRILAARGAGEAGSDE